MNDIRQKLIDTKPRTREEVATVIFMEGYMHSAGRPDWALRFRLDPAMALGLLTAASPDEYSRMIQSNMRNVILSAASFIMRDSDPDLSARLSIEAEMELHRV